MFGLGHPCGVASKPRATCAVGFCVVLVAESWGFGYLRVEVLCIAGQYSFLHVVRVFGL